MQQHDLDVDRMAAAFRKVLSEGDAGDDTKRAILIKRIPIICNDVMEIKAALIALKNDAWWVKWLTTGMVVGIGGIIAAIIIAAILTALH